MNNKLIIKMVVLVYMFFNISSIKANETKPTEVVIIAAMHGFHQDHPSYDYNTLYALVSSYKPDYVGVEIRDYDLGASSSYLQSNYPKEMIKLANLYKANVFGFDWLGDSIQGKPIPNNYWKNLKYKKLSRQISSDEPFLKKKPERLNSIEQEEYNLLDKATPLSLHDGRLGHLIRDKASLWKKWTKGSAYEEIVKFDNLRDQNIGKNINTFISENAGSRIVLVMGGAHRTYAIENIKNKFKGSVVILPVKILSNRHLINKG